MTAMAASDIRRQQHRGLQDNRQNAGALPDASINLVRYEGMISAGRACEAATQHP